MDTCIHYDLQEKNINFKLRENLTVKPGFELKGKGLLNTATGRLNYAGTLKGVYRTRAEQKGEGSSPWRLGGGLLLSNNAHPGMAPRPELHAQVKKVVSLFQGPRTVLSSKAWLNVDPAAQQFTARRASLKLSHKWLGFTKRQDLRLSAGVDLSWPVRADEAKQVPFFQVRENNWALNYRNKQWFVTYKL